MPHEPLIWTVEDDESLRFAIIGLFRSLGHRAAGFGSAEETLGAAEAARPDCIVSDIHLPGLDGIALMAEMRERGFGIPFVMITARTEPELHDRALAGGAICLLRKPFETASLIDCVDQALGLGAEERK